MDNEQSAASGSPAPVFIVGAPRSGTSILTWCLGRHPNILPLEESHWLGAFSVDVGVAHLRGSARSERSPLGMLDLGRHAFSAHFGACIDALTRAQRGALEAKSWRVADSDPAQAHPAFSAAGTHEQPKRRWIDGTPENSFYVCGLLRLFPQARFIHLVREADAVVDSMLRFRHDDGSSLVAGVAEACEYWLRAARACELAERALGSRIVLRVHHRDLVNEPEPALRRMLAFLGEEHAPECVQPLALRINSSPGESGAAESDFSASGKILAEARRMSAMLHEKPQAEAPSREARAEFEAAFDRRVRFVATLDAKYGKAQDEVMRLERELQERTAWAREVEARHEALLAESVTPELAGLRREIVFVRRLLLVPALLASGVSILFALDLLVTSPVGSVLWPVCALIGLGGYLWLRRRGIRAAVAEFDGRLRATRGMERS